MNKFIFFSKRFFLSPSISLYKKIIFSVFIEINIFSKFIKKKKIFFFQQNMIFKSYIYQCFCFCFSL